MEAKYKFVNSEEISISVYGDFEKIILDLDRNLYNNNHTETKRHVNLDALAQDKTMLKDTELDLENQVLNRTDSEVLYKAISKVKLYEQELIYNLYLRDRPETQKDYAKKLGISHANMRKRVERLKSKLAHLVEIDE